MTSATVQSMSRRKTYIRGPEPVVVFGSLVQSPRQARGTFVLPSRPELVGGPQSDLGYAIPMVIVTAELTVEQVMEAALEVGASFRVKQQMRRAVERWAQSADWRQNPHRCPSEWPTDAARREFPPVRTAARRLSRSGLLRTHSADADSSQCDLRTRWLRLQVERHRCGLMGGPAEVAPTPARCDGAVHGAAHRTRPVWTRDVLVTRPGAFVDYNHPIHVLHAGSSAWRSRRSLLAA